MPTYSYKAKDSSGKPIIGSIGASSEEAASSYLSRIGYTPISIELRIKEKKGLDLSLITEFFTHKRVKIKPEAMIVFTRQLATLVRAGIPIVTALSALSEQTENTGLKEVLLKLKKDIEGGTSLSEALGKHPHIFSELYINTVVAGETGGVLDKVLGRLAALIESDAETTASVKSAIRYPITVVVVLGIAFVILIAFVIPAFSKMFARFGSELPLPTRIMVALSHIIRGYWYIAIPSLAALIYLFNRIIKTEKGRFHWDGFRLKMPILGPLLIKMAMSKFCAMLSTLNQSGLPILRTLEIVSITVGNSVIAKEIEALRTSVADGKGVSAPLKGSKIFPPLVGNMMSIGEASGALDEMLDTIAEYYDSEIKHTVKNLTTMIEPILTFGLGFIVLILALAIFLPMWDMINVFKQGG